MAQGFELLVSHIGGSLGLKCREHGDIVWGQALQILPDGRFDTSKLKCYEKHVHLIDNPYSVLG